jgi:aminopeptidase N
VLPRVADPLLRQLLWGTLWEMVRGARYSSLEFLDLARLALPGERDDHVLAAALDASRGALARYVPEERRIPEARRFVGIALAALSEVPEGDLRTLWLRGAIAAAADPADVEALAGVVDAAAGGPGGGPTVAVDREMRWGVAALAVAHGLPGAADRLEVERAADPSDRGAREALQAEVGAPDPAVKAAAWERIHGEGYGSFQLTQAALRGFLHAHQAELLAPYAEHFFEAVPAIARERDHPFLRSYVTALFPHPWPSPDVVERARDLADAEADRLPSLRRLLHEAADDMERSIVCRSFAALRSRSGA